MAKKQLIRKYTAIVTVSLVSPDGKVLDTKTESVNLDVDMKDFPEGPTTADEHMKDELGAMLAAGAYNIESCFD